MKISKSKRFLCAILVAILAMSVFLPVTEANAGSSTANYNAVLYNENGGNNNAMLYNETGSNDRSQEPQFLPVNPSLLSEVLTGLIGFEDIDLSVSESISVIVEFKNMPEKVAMAYAEQNNTLSLFGANRYKELASLDRDQFQQGLENIFGTQLNTMSGSSAQQSEQPYKIGWEYDTVVNGLEIKLPANMVSSLLEIESVNAIYPNLTVSLGLPEDGVVFVNRDGIRNYQQDAELPGGQVYSDDFDSTKSYGMFDTREYLEADVLNNEGITGKGVLVGVIDSGVDYYHPDLIDAFLDAPPEGSGGETITIVDSNGESVTKFFGWNFYDAETSGLSDVPSRGETSLNDPMESSYKEWLQTQYPDILSNGATFYTFHGTHVAGELLGRGVAEDLKQNFFPQAGIAPEANLIAYRSLGPYGTGSLADTIKAIDQAAADGCDVVNMSLGSSINSPYFFVSTAVNNAVLAYDVVFCVSAGNNSSAALDSFNLNAPGTAQLAITVGAVHFGTIETDDASKNIVQFSIGDQDFIAGMTHKDYNSRFHAVEGTDYFINNFPGLAGPDENGMYSFIVVPTKGEFSNPPYPGYGTEDDFAAMGASIKGKIAIIRRDPSAQFDPAILSALAFEAGAGGLLVIDNTDIPEVFSARYANIVPTFTVTQSVGSVFRSQLHANGMKARITAVPEFNTDEVAAFSSRGPVGTTFEIKPDIIAPGVAVYSTFPYYLSDYGSYLADPDDYSSAYSTISGTSMSTPQVSGLVALMLSRDIGINGRDVDGRTFMKPIEVKSRLMNTADNENLVKASDGSTYGVYDVGAGRTHLIRAINAEAYVTVESEIIGIDGQLDGTYGLTTSDVASFSFGMAPLGEETEKSLVATIHNTTDDTKEFDLSYEMNATGVLTQYSDEITLSFSPVDVISVGGNTTSDFTVYLNAPDSIEEEGSYEGYVILTNRDDPTEVYRLPFSVYMEIPGDYVSEFFAMLPVISVAGGSAQVAMDRNIAGGTNFLINSANASIILKLRKKGQIGANFYVSYADGFDHENPEYLGRLTRTTSLNNVPAERYFMAGIIAGYHKYGDIPGREGYIYDDFTPLEPGRYIVTMEIVNSAQEVVERHTTDLYVASESPKISNITLDTMIKRISGKVSDTTLDIMKANGAINEADGTPFSYTDNLKVFAFFNDSGTDYWVEAAVTEDGAFTLNLSNNARPVNAAPGSWIVISPIINDSTVITLYAINCFAFNFIPFTQSNARSVKGFNPEGGSFIVDEGNGGGYYGVNKSAYTFAFGELAKTSLSDYDGLTLAVEESVQLHLEMNDRARAGITPVWSSNNSECVAVDQDGVLTAVSAGTAIIESSGSMRTELLVTVVEPYHRPVTDVSAGVSIDSGDYVYYGSLKHPTLLSVGATYGPVAARESEKTPVLWRVMGEEEVNGGGTDGNLTIMSQYLLDSLMFNSTSLSAHYSDSTIREFLNGKFLKTFSASENSSIPAITVYTDFYPNAATYNNQYDLHDFTAEDYIVTDQKVYLPWGKMITTTSDPTVNESHIYWSADGRYEANELDNDLKLRRAILKNGDIDFAGIGSQMSKYYWLRGKTEYPVEPGVDFVLFDGRLNGGVIDVTYGSLPHSVLGVRPITKLVPENIVFAHEITSNVNAVGAIAPDSNYLIPTAFSNGKAYKLTVLGNGYGASVGAHSFSVDFDEGYITLSDIQTDKSGAEYVLAYKIVGSDNKAVMYGELPTGAEGQPMEIDYSLNSLEDGASYTLYTWLQKNNEINSNEAGTVAYYSFVASGGVDNPMPAIVSIVPNAQTEDVDINGNIVIEFDIAMSPAGDVYIRAEGETYSSPLSGGTFDSTGKIFTVSYSDLDYRTRYYIKLEGFMSDSAKPRQIATSVDVYSFTTNVLVDEIKPEIIHVSPSGSDVSPSTTKLTVSFNKVMDQSVTGDVELNGVPLTTFIWMDSTSIEYTLPALAYETHYMVDISGFTDNTVPGNQMEGTYTHEFSTGYVPPNVVSITPVGSGAPLEGKLTVTFDQPMSTHKEPKINLRDTGLRTTAVTGGLWSEDRTVYTVKYSGVAYSGYYACDISGAVSDKGVEMKQYSNSNQFVVVAAIAVGAQFMVSPTEIALFTGETITANVNYNVGDSGIIEYCEVDSAGSEKVVIGALTDGTVVQDVSRHTFTIEAIAAGVAQIEVKLFDGNNDVVGNVPITVTIVDPPTAGNSFAIIVQDDGNGTAVTEKTFAASGETVNISATATMPGYVFDKWVLVYGPDGFYLDDTQSPSSAFEMPVGVVVVKAVFKQADYSITINNVAGGTASTFDMQATAKHKEIVKLTAVPDENYIFAGWQIEPAYVMISGNSFSMPAADVVITPVFIDASPVGSHSVDVTVQGSGTAWALPQQAAAGTQITLHQSAAAGWHFVGWISGEVQVANNTFIMPDGDVTVTAVFERDMVIQQHIVRFYNWNALYDTKLVNDGASLAGDWPGTPVRNGYLFDGWYTAGGVLYTQSTAVYESVDLYASWSLVRKRAEMVDIQSQIPTASLQQQETLSSAIAGANESNSDIVYWNMKSEESVALTKADIKNLIEGELTLALASRDWTIEIQPTLWALHYADNASKIEIFVTRPGKDVVEPFYANTAANGSRINDALKGLATEIKIVVDGRVVSELRQPITLKINLAAYAISDNEQHYLTIARAGADGTAHYLGDRFDAQNKILSTEISRSGMFGAMYAPDLKKLDMTIGGYAYSINGVEKISDVAPIIVNDRTLVSARFFAEAFGAQVDWDDSTKTVTITLGDHKLVIQIGSMHPGMDVPAQIINDRTMVPFRFLAEELGVNVVYDTVTSSIRGYR